MFSEKLKVLLARGPDQLAISYGRAARILCDSIPHAEHRLGVNLDVPAFYAIRHSVELALKELLWAHHSNEVDRGQLGHAGGTAEHSGPLSTLVLKKLGGTHDLQWLLDQVKACLSPLVPPHWTHLVRDLEAHEGDSPEWSRYEGGRVPVHERSGVPSWEHRFHRPREVPVRDLVTQLEVFLRESVFLDFENVAESDAASWSILQSLLVESDALAQELFAEGGEA